MRQPGKTALRNQKGIAPLALLLLLVVILSAAWMIITYPRWEGRPPQLSFDHDFKALGRHPTLTLKVEDPGTGIHLLSVLLRQKDQQTTLVDDKLPGPSLFRFWGSGSVKSREIDLGNLI